MRRVSYGPPILSPLPNIPQNVIKAIVIWWECCDRTCTSIPILSRVRNWEFSLPRVCHVVTTFLELVTPRVFSAIIKTFKRCWKQINTIFTCTILHIICFFPLIPWSIYSSWWVSVLLAIHYQLELTINYSVFQTSLIIQYINLF